MILFKNGGMSITVNDCTLAQISVLANTIRNHKVLATLGSMDNGCLSGMCVVFPEPVLYIDNGELVLENEDNLATLTIGLNEIVHIGATEDFISIVTREQRISMEIIG